MQATDEPSNIVALPAAITIDTVEALAGQFKQSTFAPPMFTLDAAQTEIITTPGIQLLLALHKTLVASGIALRITQAKPSFRQAFDSLGLKNNFTEWEATHD